MTATTTPQSTTETPAASWFDPKRDRYGRTTRSLYAIHHGRWGCVAVVVTMPKSWVQSHGDDRYMVSDWRRDQQTWPGPAPIYFRSLARARAHAESLIES